MRRASQLVSPLTFPRVWFRATRQHGGPHARLFVPCGAWGRMAARRPIRVSTPEVSDRPWQMMSPPRLGPQPVLTRRGASAPTDQDPDIGRLHLLARQRREHLVERQATFAYPRRHR